MAFTRDFCLAPRPVPPAWAWYGVNNLKPKGFDVPLPIEAYEARIVEAVREHRVVVVAAETGAGKSTLVPLMLLRAGLAENGLIGVTQPRRVAAMTVSSYVAFLHGSALGETIGFHIRAQRQFGRETRIKFMTEGILLRELHSDPELRRYQVVVVDEAHERGVNQDLLLALLKQVLRRRDDLRVLIMSATIDEQRFADHFGGAPIIKVPGRVYSVDVRYEEETLLGIGMVVQRAAEKVVEIISSRDSGDILVFMPDEETIKAVCALLEASELRGLRILPLYGTQSPDEQREVFRRDGQRRVIVATNIAETSITLDGVRHVVDSGLIKSMTYVSASMSALKVGEHSQAGCEQRCGRAGRTQAGICHRLFTQADFAERPQYTSPEIQRMSLDQVLLHLRALGYSLDEVLSLEFMDPPGEERWREAENRLRTLGALGADGQVSDDGLRMERLPVAPMLGRMVLEADKYGCLKQIVPIVAGFTTRPVFVRPRGKEEEADQQHTLLKDARSDALTLLRVWQLWSQQPNGARHSWARERFLSSRALCEIDRNYAHVLSILEREGFKTSSDPHPDKISKAVAAGLIVNLCIKEEAHSYLWHGREVHIHPSSAMFRGLAPRMMVCAEVVQTSKTFARGCSAVEETWLEEIIPVAARKRTWKVQKAFFDQPATVVETWMLGETALSHRELNAFPPEALPDIARELVDGMTQWGSFHPQGEQHRLVWDEICEIRRWRSAEALKEREELVERLQAYFLEKLTGCCALDEVCARDLTLRLGDWVQAEDLEERETRLREEWTYRQQGIAERQGIYRQRAVVAEEQRRERTATIATLRQEFEDLDLRVRALGVGPHSDIGFLRTKINLWLNGDHTQTVTIRNALDRLRAAINTLERDTQEKRRLAHNIRDEVLKRVPACPICGEMWRSYPQDRYRLWCQNTHDRKRLLWLEGKSEGEEIGVFLTNRDDRAAWMRFGIHNGYLWLVFETASGDPWTGRVFKSIRYEPSASILPVDLAPQREQILADLRELQKARQELEALTAKLREVESRVGTGAVKCLTFRIRGGRAVADDGRTIYVADYRDPYPNEGETWLCEIVFPSSTSPLKEIVATPILKAGAIASSNDLEELRRLVAESYPGLPEEALVH